MEVLIFLLFLLAVITVVGHFIWWVLASIIRWLVSDSKTASWPSSDQAINRASDLDITERQIVKFYREGRLTDETYEALMKQIRVERAGYAPPETAPPIRQKEPVVSTDAPPAVVAATLIATDDEIVIEPLPSTAQEEQFTPPPRPPRRSFSEVLNSFMEESNIRWGEIIGGLLIIGCSTALVVSLWAQISQIPVLKFLIFTTVTAVLFGIGLYTEHRWKLPTTSRAWRGSRAAAELQRADLDRARCGRFVSGEYVGSHLVAGTAGLLDRRYSPAFALAQSPPTPSQCISDSA